MRVITAIEFKKNLKSVCEEISCGETIMIFRTNTENIVLLQKEKIIELLDEHIEEGISADMFKKNFKKICEHILSGNTLTLKRPNGSDVCLISETLYNEKFLNNQKNLL